MEHSDRVIVNLSGFDLGLVKEALSDLHYKRLCKTPWVRKEGTGHYWYQGDKSSRQVESIQKYLDNQLKCLDTPLSPDLLLNSGYIGHPDMEGVFIVPNSKNFGITCEKGVGWYFVLIIYNPNAGYITLAKCGTVGTLNNILNAFEIPDKIKI